MPWYALGEGSYNTAYCNADTPANATQVFKVQKDKREKTDSAKRSVDLWNRINRNLRPPAQLHNDKLLGKGWVCPFVHGRQSTDKEIADALLDIYNRTGRIVTDAPTRNNFITTPEGTVVCVDIGYALDVEEKEHEFFTKEINQGRRKSLVSLKAWAEMEDLYIPYFEERKKNSYTQTVDTIQALLFIKKNRPDIHDVGFLVNNKPYVDYYAAAYRGEYTTPTAMYYLNQQVPPEFNLAKEACVAHLTRYIQSRGSVTYDNTFKPSLVTGFLESQTLSMRR